MDEYDEWQPMQDLQDDLDSRVPWVGTADGRVFFGDRGGLHDDLIVDAGLSYEDAKATGIVQGGTVWIYDPIDDQAWINRAQEAWDDNTGVRLGAADYDVEWMPDMTEGIEGTNGGRPWMIKDNMLYVGDWDTHHFQWGEYDPDGPVPDPNASYYDRDATANGKIWNPGTMDYRVLHYEAPYDQQQTSTIAKLVKALWTEAVKNGGKLQLGGPQGHPGASVSASGEELDSVPVQAHTGAQNGLERVSDLKDFHNDSAQLLEEYAALARDIAKTLPEDEWPRWVKNQLLRQADVPDALPEDWHLAAGDWLQKSMDRWTGPLNSTLNEGVDIPGETGARTMDGINAPDVKNNWMYLNGEVAFGGHNWDLAHQLASKLKLSDDEVRLISNSVARQHLPAHMDIAYGEMRQDGYPQIWNSTLDRNHVWDTVVRAHQDKTQHTASDEWDPIKQPYQGVGDPNFEQFRQRSQEVAHRFDAIASQDGGPIDGNDEDVLYETVEEGWMQKFVILNLPDRPTAAAGLKGIVWGDGEQGMYDGMWAHADEISGYLDDEEAARVDHNTNALGWVRKPPLKEGDLPWEVDMLSGFELTDEQVLSALTLKPGEGKVERNVETGFFGGGGWGAFGSMKIGPQKDEWWKTGCPECGNPEMDTHLHGGLSCTQCGQEFEQMPDGLLISSIPPEPEGVLWPDTLPWSEEMQDYYRKAGLIVNPVNYEFVPLTDTELERKGPGKNWNWSNRARRQNVRAREHGAEGTVTARELHALVKRYEFNCAYCGQPFGDPKTLTFDHVIPLSRGGTNTVANLLPVGYDCNHEMNEWDQRIEPNTEIKYTVPPDVFSKVAAPRLGEALMARLVSDGGFSVNIDGTDVAPGYYTSIEGHERIILLNSIIADDINNYIHDHQDLLRQTDNFLGAWVSDGDVYLDVSRSFQSVEEVMEFARANHQQAAWDGFNHREIPVTPEAPATL